MSFAERWAFVELALLVLASLAGLAVILWLWRR